MNNFLFLVLCCLFLIQSSCNSINIVEEIDVKDIDEVVINIQPFEFDDGTSRANIDASFKPTWAPQDTVGIFPAIGGQVEFPITTGFGTSNAKFNGGGWALKSNYLYHAYYPFNFYNRNSKAIPFSYLGQEQDGNNSLNHVGKYLLLTTLPTKSSDDALDFSFRHMGSIMKIVLTLPEATSYKSMSIYSDAEIFPVKKTFDLQSEEVDETIVELSKKVTLKLKNVETKTKNEEVTFYIVLPSVTEAGHKLSVVIYDIYGLPYTAPIFKLSDPSVRAVTPINRNSASNRIASPVLTEGFNFGVGGWGSNGTDHGGSVN